MDTYSITVDKNETKSDDKNAMSTRGDSHTDSPNDPDTATKLFGTVPPDADTKDGISAIR